MYNDKKTLGNYSGIFPKRWHCKKNYTNITKGFSEYDVTP